MNAIAQEPKVKLGALHVTRQGYGAMGLSNAYGKAEDAASIATLHRAIELGINFFDTAEAYGKTHNETLLGAAFAGGKREKLVLATKFSGVLDDRGDVSAVARAAEASLTRLRTDVIDLYYLHRYDARFPIEDVIGAFARLVEAGKIRAIGVSELSAATLRRAHAVHPITAIQSEYSLWTRDFEADVLPAARELGVGFVAYSPLGRGFLAGQEAAGPEDRRAIHPRFQADALAANKLRRAALEAVAARLNVTAAQLALAWVLAQNVVPIPGTRHITHLEQNWAANRIVLDAATLAELEAAFPPGGTAGARYPADALARVNV